MSKYIRDSNSGGFKQAVNSQHADRLINNAISGPSFGYTPQMMVQPDFEPQQRNNFPPDIGDLVDEAIPQENITTGGRIGQGLASLATGFASGFTGNPSMLNNYLGSLDDNEEARRELKKALMVRSMEARLPTDKVRNFEYYQGLSPEQQSQFANYEATNDPYKAQYLQLAKDRLGATMADQQARRDKAEQEQIDKLTGNYQKNIDPMLNLFTGGFERAAEKIAPDFDFKNYDSKTGQYSIVGPDGKKIWKKPSPPSTDIGGWALPNFLNEKGQSYDQALEFLTAKEMKEIYGTQIPSTGEGKSVYDMLQKGSFRSEKNRLDAAKILYDIAQEKLKQKESGFAGSPYGTQALEQIERGGGQTFRKKYGDPQGGQLPLGSGPAPFKMSADDLSDEELDRQIEIEKQKLLNQQNY